MHMNYHDDLTGLYNRTYFNKIKAEIDCEDHLPLSLIAADIDGLKFINDSFGHLEGDEILKLAGQLFKRTFRKEDIITRTGGDEFVIFLPRTSQKDSHRLIDRLNAEKKRYNQKNNQKAHYLSISLGVATKTRPDQDFNELLKKADYQMYEQKNRKKKDLNKHLIFSMKKALFNKLPDLEEATKRWAKIAREIGAAIGLSDDQLKQVDRLTILGELGKITIDEQILAKRGELSDQEKKDYYKHPELAGRIAKAIPAWKSLAPAILALGENWDGSGYPEGLSGEAIPLLSRILALAKFFDQLDQEESGQKRRKSDQIAELKKVSGSRFDPRLVKVLINLLQEEGRS